MTFIPIENLGGGSADKNYYLLKGGKRKVAFDNGLYVSDASCINDGGWTFEETKVSSTCTQNMHERAFTTSDLIDVSKYSKICALYNGDQVLSVDVSAINASGYISVYNVSFVSNNSFGIALSTIKANFYTNRITFKDINLPRNSFYVTDVWLEP